jgi:DNA-binding transcriptional MocR family regulator
MASRKIGAASLARLMEGWRSDDTRLPTYRQIQRALQLLILDGRLPIGIRLPGERHLAVELGISRTTAAAAYAELRELGFANSRHGSGSVTQLPGKPELTPPDVPGSAEIEFSIAALPAPKEVHAAYARALSELPRYLPTTGYEPAGLPMLRAAIASRFAERGAPTSPDQILVTQGAQHGLVLVLALLARPGDRIVLDHPTYSKALEAIASASCHPVPVALPANGWDLDQVAAAFAQTDAKLGYLLPDFHNPTGRCMDEFSRARLAKLAADRQCHLLIDETMAELWLDASPPRPLAAFDRADRIITLGSMGKSFWGGMRIGWVRAHRDIIAALAAARSSNDMGSPILEQLAAAALLERPEEPLNERRAVIRRQRDHLLSVVRNKLPDWKFVEPAGGLSAWAELPLPASTALAAAAFDLGLRIAPGSRFGIDGAFARFVRLPYALPEEELTVAVDRLAQAWGQVTSGGNRRRGNPPAALAAAI